VYIVKMVSDVVQYVGSESLKAKATGNPFELVSFGDAATFEKFDFFKRDDLNMSGITEGTKVKLELKVSKRGFANQFDLIAVHRVQ